MLSKNRLVKLQRPTDFLILDSLEGGRNVAVNIAEEIDKSRSHVNVRLPQLQDHGLVTKVGPSDNSGLYEITDLGRLAVEHQAEYDSADDFGDFIKSKRSDQTHA